jgi:hypothetical protein
MDYSDVPFDAKAAGLLTVEEARGQLEVAAPLDCATFWTGDPGLAAEYGKGWDYGSLTDPCAAWVTTPEGEVYQLTRQAAQMLASTAKLNKKYQEFLPPALLTSCVNFALQEGLDERELKLLLSGTPGRGPAPAGESDGTECPLAVAQCRATITPFSDVRLLDTVLLAVRAKLGHAVADSAEVDPKIFHDLEHTSFRVVFPAAQQVIAGTGEDDDAWCFGIEVSNSLIGAKQTVVSGYMFRLATTAGVTDVERSLGGFNRRGSTPEAVFGWAAEAADYCLDGMEAAFNGLQVLTRTGVDADYNTVLAQLFRDYPVAKDLKFRILSALEDTPGRLSMYDVAHAASVTANLNGTNWRAVRSLLDLAGGIVHQGGGMCDGSLPAGCRRLLPEDWTPPAGES